VQPRALRNEDHEPADVDEDKRGGAELPKVAKRAREASPRRISTLATASDSSPCVPLGLRTDDRVEEGNAVGSGDRDLPSTARGVTNAELIAGSAVNLSPVPGNHSIAKVEPKKIRVLRFRKRLKVVDLAPATGTCLTIRSSRAEPIADS
jgi:hypothetical protein